MTDIALFPIPNCVCFPGTLFPLHVFEPRYRKMIEHCLSTGMPLAVCHTEKTLSTGPGKQALEEALRSNQATYKPRSVFSAGKCELLETLDDGRMHVVVHVDARYQSLEELQILPFPVHRCERIDDIDETENFEALRLLREKILHRLMALTTGLPAVQDLLRTPEWQAMPPEQFSFKLFGLLRLDADVQQSLLEVRSPSERMREVLAILNAGSVS